jgi:hypothetical protein
VAAISSSLADDRQKSKIAIDEQQITESRPRILMRSETLNQESAGPHQRPMSSARRKSAWPGPVPAGELQLGLMLPDLAFQLPPLKRSSDRQTGLTVKSWRASSVDHRARLRG